jgi:F0F1-type ATP synthase membrane subunit c/vacuolar-type H+-ATPase subunit K
MSSDACASVYCNTGWLEVFSHMSPYGFANFGIAFGLGFSVVGAAWGIWLTGSSLVGAAVKSPRIRSKNLIRLVFCDWWWCVRVCWDGFGFVVTCECACARHWRMCDTDRAAASVGWWRRCHETSAVLELPYVTLLFGISFQCCLQSDSRERGWIYIPNGAMIGGFEMTFMEKKDMGAPCDKNLYHTHHDVCSIPSSLASGMV